MARILLIETATSLCSCALARDGQIVEYMESPEPRSQAALTAVFISEMLGKAEIQPKDCDAVCVSKGPGSYTGLRVGVSSAKGLCFGADLKLLSAGTLDILAWQAIDEHLLPEGCAHIIPMIDARRMEVYTATFTPEGRMTSQIEAKIIDASSFSKELSDGPVLFIGDGAQKCASLFESNPNAHFVNCCPKASSMLHPAMTAWNEKRFEDVAYFEPFYLKQFIATESNKKLF